MPQNLPPAPTQCTPGAQDHHTTAHEHQHTCAHALNMCVTTACASACALYALHHEHVCTYDCHEQGQHTSFQSRHNFLSTRTTTVFVANHATSSASSGILASSVHEFVHTIKGTP